MESDSNTGQLKNSKKSQPAKVFKFQNSSCFICANSCYGHHLGDPACSTCHEFLYSNIASDAQNMTTLTTIQEDEEETDSASEEVIDAPYQQNVELLCSPDIESLPTEILITVFKYLDDIELWSVSRVCNAWQKILNLYISVECWKNFTLIRWPLLCLAGDVSNWYHVYTSLILSCCCIKCVRQMAAQEFSIVEHNPDRKYRLRLELFAVQLDFPQSIKAQPLDSLYYHWQATIQGPIGSPYEKGIFFLYIQVPCTYPIFPPIIRFLTRILHPNISRHGDIAMECIHQNWSADLSIRKVLLSIQSLLNKPNCDLYIEPEVNHLYLHNRKEFEEQARIWTWKYARHDFISCADIP